jgi:DNA/RNA endonuclease YhcR with UshA esterase domain
MKKNILIIVLIAVILVLGFIIIKSNYASKEQGTSISTTIKQERTEIKKESEEVISWKDAASYYGEYKTVEGTIVATYNSGKACFLNFHSNWKKYFTAVIFRSDFHKFPDNPEQYYDGKKVRITGKIKEYQGKPEIILKSPSQIEILD